MTANLCGACHQWCANPIVRDGKCTTCGLTPVEIHRCYGLVYLSEAPDRRAAQALVLAAECGYDIDSIVASVKVART